MMKIENQRERIIVVGAGIAGLSAAYLLMNMGRENGDVFDIKILEASDRHGGAMRTEESDGYLCEWGPNGFLDNEPATLELVRMLNIESELVRANDNASKRYIFHGGALRKLPMNPLAFLFSDIIPLPSRFRMMLEFLIAKKDDNTDETVESFGKRRLGNGFAKYLLDPMVSGIFAGDTAKLSLQSVFPKMVEMEREYGGLLKALIAKRRFAKVSNSNSGGPSGPNATLHTFRRGMGQLTDSLWSSLSEKVELNQTVRAVKFTDGQFTIRSNQNTIKADSVILACPSFAAADIIENISSSVSATLREIHHAPVDVVCHGHNRVDGEFNPDGFGVLIPRSEDIRSLGTLWSNSIFPGHAPSGKFLLRTIIGGAHDPEITELKDDEVEKTALKDHSTVMGVRLQPEFSRLFRHARGIAQYNLGHSDRVCATEKLEKDTSGLYFTGASYRGVSVNGCVKDAFRILRDFEKRTGNKK